MRPRLISRFLAVISATVALLGIAACGADSSDDIPGRQADQLLGLIDSIRSQVEAGECEAASADASNLSVAIQGLDRDEVPEDVITALTQGSESLRALIETQCGAEEDQTTSSTTSATTTAETTTTEDTTTTTTTTTTTDTDTTTTTSPDDGSTGGTGAGGTEAPGGQGKGGGN